MEGYSLQALAEKLKEKGLTVAEEGIEKVASQVYLAVKEWIQESALKSENKMDDMIAPFIGQLDAIVLPAIAKLDLDKDGK